MDGHHLILGITTDYLTGERLKDTHDERYRQKIARWLIEKLLYKKKEVTPRRQLVVKAGSKRARIIVDFCITSGDKLGMLIKYGPGSLTTRHMPTLASAHLVDTYSVPIVVVTNGEDAEILDTDSEQVVARGFEKIPNRNQLADIIKGRSYKPVPSKKREMAARIVYCYEIDGACPCDTTVCRLEEEFEEVVPQ